MTTLCRQFLCHYTNFIRQVAVPSKPLICRCLSMANALNSVPNVEIDVGKFKYILIKVYGPGDEEDFKYIVRGSGAAPFHADIYDIESLKIEKLGLECECMGGGRIQHNLEEKTIHVYGYSQGYGPADHSIAVGLLKEKYTDYAKIHFSNEGY